MNDNLLDRAVVELNRNDCRPSHPDSSARRTVMVEAGSKILPVREKEILQYHCSVTFKFTIDAYFSKTLNMRERAKKRAIMTLKHEMYNELYLEVRRLRSAISDGRDSDALYSIDNIMIIIDYP